MKKIVAAAAAGLLLASAAFADVSFSYTGTAIMGSQANSFTTAERNDCLSLELSNEVAGVVCDWDLNGGNAMALDSFYGWMTFGLPAGNLQITSGKWTSRYVNRVKTLAGDLDSEFYEMNKPGVINGVVGVDSDNLTGGQYSTVLAYTLADKLPGTLMVKGGIVNTGSQYDSEKKAADGDLIIKSGFVGEVAYRQEDVVALNLAVKNYVKDVMSFGAFVSPLMLDKLDSMVGFTFAKNDDASEFGVDARATYSVTEKTSVTGMVNYSSTKIGSDGKELDDAVAALWTMVSVGYTAGDNIRYVATLNNQVDNMDAAMGTACVCAFTPACEIKASEKCNVTAGFDLRWTNVKPFAGTGTVRLPIYVSFAL